MHPSLSDQTRLLANNTPTEKQKRLTVFSFPCACVFQTRVSTGIVGEKDNWGHRLVEARPKAWRANETRPLKLVPHPHTNETKLCVGRCGPVDNHSSLSAHIIQYPFIRKKPWCRTCKRPNPRNKTWLAAEYVEEHTCVSDTKATFFTFLQVTSLLER